MLQTLQGYYLTNFTHCHVDDHFLTTPRGLTWSSHSIQSLSLPVQIFAFYLIVAKTPKVMKSVKYPLLAVHLSSTLFDLVMCSLITIFIFYPSYSFHGAGILSMLGVNWAAQVFLMTLSAMGVAMSLVNIFESRSRAISANPWAIRSRRKRIVVLLFQIVIFSSLWLMFLQTPSPENQELLKLNALELNPCPVPEYFLESTIILFSSKIYGDMFIFAVLQACFQVFLQVFFHSACCVYFLYRYQSNIFSERTRHLQRRFFEAIVLNFLTVVLTFGSAGLLITFAFLLDLYDQKVMSLVILMIETHGIVESITLILVHQPYREAVRRMMCIPSKLKKATRNISMDSTTVGSVRALKV